MAFRITESNARDLRLMRRKVLGHNMAGTPSDRGYLPAVGMWCRLGTNLDAGGTASGAPKQWDPSADSGDGDYVDYTDLGETVNLRDCSGQHWGIAGEMVWCVYQASDNAGFWEVMSSGSPRHKASLTEDLLAGDSAVAQVSILSTPRNVTVYDEFLEASEQLDGSTWVGIVYDTAQAKWIVTNAPC